MIVELRDGPEEFERLKKRLSRIDGVVQVDFNYLNRKLTVVHDGREDSLKEIEKAVTPLRSRRAKS